MNGKLYLIYVEFVLGFKKLFIFIFLFWGKVIVYVIGFGRVGFVIFLRVFSFKILR